MQFSVFILSINQKIADMPIADGGSQFLRKCIIHKFTDTEAGHVWI